MAGHRHAALTLGLLSLAACADETVAPIDGGVISFAGELEGSDAVAAVALSGDEVALYVCGGSTSYATRSRWYLGKSDAGSAELASDDGGTAEVTVGDGEVSGTITEPGGEPFPFRLELMRASGPGGLYFVIDSGCRTGVVVIDHGASSEPTVQGTWCSDQDIFAQVTPITPIDDTTREIQVKTIATDLAPTKKLVVGFADPAAF
ncbi:MAG TPA: hypothetical protein VL400_00680 [Polyangiaceae bacterium]|jgi:hypothetical protein|nr:hypothetical protein [Polyangiaceae bacterium]